MVDKPTTAVTHWALLIGINYYVKDICLKGAVRDAETIEQYLKAEPIPADITILTATSPREPDSTLPLEAPGSWPTHANVIRSLKRILDKAKPGNFVYIHYSGHGTRRSDGHLAFVLFENTNLGSSYLVGEVLRKCLDMMVKKGLLVTLVLDCCHSGSVARTAEKRVDVRAVAYNALVDAASPQEFDPGTSSSESNSRIIRILSNEWLLNPNEYTILSACGPHEKAEEIEIQGGERRGALTFFLLLALEASKKIGGELTHRSLYQELRVRFHASWPQQTPMSYGNQDFTFFGKLGVTSGTNLVPVYKTNEGGLHLSAGQVHDVCKGDMYALYPYNHSENAKNQAGIHATVDTVRALTSDIVIEHTRSTQAVAQIAIRWKAKLIAWRPRQKIHIRLMSSVEGKLEWRGLDPQSQRFFHLSAEGEETESCIFNVNLNENEQYEILDTSYKRIASLPTVPLVKQGASNHVMGILQHLGIFKYFEAVQNRTPNQSFEDLFKLPSADDTGIINIRHGEKWHFVIENVGKEPLYMTMFNLDSSWAVSNLISNEGQGDFLMILPKGEGENGKQEIDLKMNVPEALLKLDKCECEDIVKVFITNRAMFCPLGFLPEMPLGAESLSAGLRDHLSGSSHHMDSFLSELIPDFRVPGPTAGFEARTEEWACRNFIIRTHT